MYDERLSFVIHIEKIKHHVNKRVIYLGQLANAFTLFLKAPSHLSFGKNRVMGVGFCRDTNLNYVTYRTYGKNGMKLTTHGKWERAYNCMLHDQAMSIIV